MSPHVSSRHGRSLLLSGQIVLLTRRLSTRRFAALIGCGDDEVGTLMSGVKADWGVTAVPLLSAVSALAGARTLSSLSSSSCSTSDPHTHCSSTDLHTPNYTQQPHDAHTTLTVTPHTWKAGTYRNNWSRSEIVGAVVELTGRSRDTETDTTEVIGEFRRSVNR